MTFIGKQASALFLALCFSAYSNAQDYVTDNLVQSNAWEGCYTLTQTATWGGTSGGPCPNVSLDGGINFSWGQYTLSQNISINQALAAAGTGLQITGYTYSWSVKNSNINGQQPGLYDWYTHINVDLLSPTGQILESDFYPYGYWIPQWTQFSGVRTYSSPYSLASASTLRLSVSGWDDGYWAGYYGPEYGGFDLRINYSVDPCTSDPLYSPTCPGYTQAIMALMSSTEVVTTTPMVEIVETNTGIEATPVAQNRINLGSGVSVASVLSMIARDSARIAVLERSVIESSQEQSNSINLQIQEIDIMAVQASTNHREAAVSGSSIDTNNSVDNSAVHQVSVAGFSTVDLLDTGSKSINNDSTSSQSSKAAQPATENNELAGGIAMAALTVQPAGFSAYYSTLPDGTFYAPREIYRGQQVVDNIRVLRGLGADRVFNEMIDQQYRR